MKHRRQHARNVWRSHRGSRRHSVAARIAKRASTRRHCGQGANARGGDIHIRHAVIREVRPQVIRVGGKHRDDPAVVVGTWIHWSDVRIRSAVAGGTNIDNSRGFYGGHGVLQRHAVPITAPGVAGDPNVEPLLLQDENLVEAQYGIGNVSASVGIEKFAGEELCTPIYAGHALTVIGHGANRSRHMSAMSIIVLAACNAGAVNAGETVGAVSRIHPQIALQIRVRVIDARVDNGHDHIARAGLSVPGLRGGNLRHVPLLRPERICRGCRIDTNHVIGLGVEHRVIGPVLGNCSHWIRRWNHSRPGLALESDKDSARMEGWCGVVEADYSDILVLLSLSRKTYGSGPKRSLLTGSQEDER